MCNLYRLEKGPDAIRKLFDQVQIPLGFPEGVPNFEPRDVHITDRAPIVRASDSGAAQLVERRWSWPGPTGKPVYNLRSDNREFPTGRCLVLADGFYEYTAPADPKQKRKDRWLFTPADGEPFAIAGFVRDTPGIGEAFSLLTTVPSSRRRALSQPAGRPAPSGGTGNAGSNPPTRSATCSSRSPPAASRSKRPNRAGRGTGAPIDQVKPNGSVSWP